MRVTAPDLELWLTDLVQQLAAADSIEVDVGNKEPSNLQLPIERPLIVIRDDSGARLDWTTFNRSIGATVLAGTKLNDQPANDLGRWLAAILHDNGLVDVDGSPIAFVDWDGCNGPYAVAEELDVARRYLTAQYVVTGSW